MGKIEAIIVPPNQEKCGWKEIKREMTKKR
jgi:hypothetical protein